MSKIKPPFIPDPNSVYAKGLNLQIINYTVMQNNSLYNDEIMEKLKILLDVLDIEQFR